MSVGVEYLAAGANRHAAGADWGRRGLLAFGADVNVALWRPDLDPPRGVEALLSGHAGVVKAVAFLPAEERDEAEYLVSGADDKTLIVWKSTPGGRGFGALQTCADHDGAVNCISAFRPAPERARWIVATGAADATVRVWAFEHDDGRLRLLQTLHTAPKFFPLAVAVAALGSGALVLAVAGTRDAVQILTADLDADADDDDAAPPRFALQATLAGHEGWVRSLSFAAEPRGDVLLASASQDKYVRIWRIRHGRDPPAVAADSDPRAAAAKSPANKAHRLAAAGRDYSVSFEALLLGHEDWIYGATWHARRDGRLRLLSTSADNSLAVWEADASSGIWVSTVRLGEISREKGATTATGSAGGFWCGLWSPDGRSVACLGRTGSWRRWRLEDDDDDAAAWLPCVAVSGHTKAVTGLAWSRAGSYLLSTGSDQTTRLHARWVGAGGGGDSWHEMSRPQIHGYDLNCIDSLGESRFVSGADEKLMRVFTEPRAVAALLHGLAAVPEADAELMADAANMPTLGLSNKAVDAAAGDDDDAAATTTPGAGDAARTQHPPLEETLSRHTLWPETEKLYGHGYELSCLAASHDGALVASACKASSANHAVIRLFETRRWTELRPPLTAHSLTATRLRFSPDDALLLSVGRDRQWAVFERDPDAAAAYRLRQSNPKGHARMILDAAWAPATDDDGPPLFATAGRDKQVRIWAARPAFVQTAALPCAAPVTAVDFLPTRVAGRFVLAVGTEAGRLSLCRVEADGSAVVEMAPTTELAFPSAVLQLAWRPSVAGGECSRHILAAAGEDSSLRIFAFDDVYINGSPEAEVEAAD